MNTLIKNALLGVFLSTISLQAYPEYLFGTLAGAWAAGSADGTGSAARFNITWGAAFDRTTGPYSGYAYVADSGNHTIRRISPAGVVTTLAGSPGVAGFADGNGGAARFNWPVGVAVDANGNVLVTDRSNYRIRKITPAGYVSTIAGAGSWGSQDGVGTGAYFSDPTGIAIDSSGNVFVAEGNSGTIRKITPSYSVSTFVGVPFNLGTVDGVGAGARMGAGLWSIGIDMYNNLYVPEYNSNVIRKISSGAVVTTLAGFAGSSGSTDGTGSSARFNAPVGVATDSDGTCYVTDMLNSVVRKISPTGVVTTLGGSYAGNFSEQDCTDHTSGFAFYYPAGIAIGLNGKLVVCNMSGKIRNGNRPFNIMVHTNNFGTATDQYYLSNFNMFWWYQVPVLNGALVLDSQSININNFTSSFYWNILLNSLNAYNQDGARLVTEDVYVNPTIYGPFLEHATVFNSTIYHRVKNVYGRSVYQAMVYKEPDVSAHMVSPAATILSYDSGIALNQLTTAYNEIASSGTATPIVVLCRDFRDPDVLVFSEPKFQPYYQGPADRPYWLTWALSFGNTGGVITEIEAKPFNTPGVEASGMPSHAQITWSKTAEGLSQAINSGRDAYLFLPSLPGSNGTDYQQAVVDTVEYLSKYCVENGIFISGTSVSIVHSRRFHVVVGTGDRFGLVSSATKTGFYEGDDGTGFNNSVLAAVEALARFRVKMRY